MLGVAYQAIPDPRVYLARATARIYAVPSHTAICPYAPSDSHREVRGMAISRACQKGTVFTPNISASTSSWK